MNPFVFNYRINVVQVNETYILNSTKVSNPGSLNKLVVPNSYYVEKPDKTSVYHTIDITKLLFVDLKAIGRDMFNYVVINLKKDKDYIEFDRDRVCKDMDISIATFYAAITQLVKANVLYKINTRAYYINPHFIFNGNRVDYFEGLKDEYNHINIVHRT